MICNAEIRTALRADGSTALAVLRSEPPITLMPAGELVYLVGSAAGPLTGDRISLTINVVAGTTLTVRTVAASIAWPGTGTDPSEFQVTARVGEGATLHWLPEALVPVFGGSHRMLAHVDVAPGGLALWREELVLGRHREGPGALTTRLTARVDGRVAVRQELAVGPGAPGAGGPAVTSGAKTTGTLSVLGGDRAAIALRPSAELLAATGAAAATLELEHGGWQTAATATGAVALRRALDAALLPLLEPVVAPELPKPVARPNPDERAEYVLAAR